MPEHLYDWEKPQAEEHEVIAFPQTSSVYFHHQRGGQERVRIATLAKIARDLNYNWGDARKQLNNYREPPRSTGTVSQLRTSNNLA